MAARSGELPDAAGRGDPILVLRGISKHFGAVAALDQVDLDLHRGEVLALVGDNGAGKSTLVKILAGVHAPSSGSFSFEGRERRLHGPQDARNLGMETVFQDLALAVSPEVRLTKFTCLKLCPFSDCARQSAFIQRHACQNSYALLLAKREEPLLRARVEDVVDHLHGIDEAGLDGGDAVFRFPAIDADAEEADEAFGLQALGDFEEMFIVGPAIFPDVELKNVNRIGAELFEDFAGVFEDVFGGEDILIFGAGLGRPVAVFRRNF